MTTYGVFNVYVFDQNGKQKGNLGRKKEIEIQKEKKGNEKLNASGSEGINLKGTKEKQEKLGGEEENSKR